MVSRPREKIFPLDHIDLCELQHNNSLYQTLHKKRNSNHSKISVKSKNSYGEIEDAETLQKELSVFDDKFTG